MSTLFTSFDVFETLLARPYGSPETAFLLLARRLSRQGLLPCSAHAFAALRVQAEKRCFANGDGIDGAVQLADIYQELAFGLAIDPNQLMRAEIEFESELISPIPAGIRRLNQARNAGQKIAFFSDSVLPKEVVANLLTQHAIMRPADHLLVSSDERKSKASGTLYRAFLSRYQLKPEHVRHHGNNAYSDVYIPSEQGLVVSPFLRGNLNRFERVLDSLAGESDGLSGALAGASRLARLSITCKNWRKRTIVDVAAGAMSPLLIGSILWALQSARANKVTQLWFASSDGLLPIALAKILAKRLKLNIDLQTIETDSADGFGLQARELRLRLASAGLKRSTRAAIVDITGRSGAIKAFSRVAQTTRSMAICVYTLSSSAHPAARLGQTTIFPYLSNVRSGHGYHSKSALTVVRTLCQPPLTATLGEQSQSAWSDLIAARTILTVAKRLCLDHDLVGVEGDLRRGAVDVARLFWNHPSAHEAAVWGDPNNNAAHQLPIAQAYRVSALFTGAKHAGNEWHRGALAMSNPLLRSSLTFRNKVLRQVAKSWDKSPIGLTPAPNRASMING